MLHDRRNFFRFSFPLLPFSWRLLLGSSILFCPRPLLGYGAHSNSLRVRIVTTDFAFVTGFFFSFNILSQNSDAQFLSMVFIFSIVAGV